MQVFLFACDECATCQSVGAILIICQFQNDRFDILLVVQLRSTKWSNAQELLSDLTSVIPWDVGRTREKV